MHFEWDLNKALPNENKHGVSFTEAKSCFFDVEQIAFYDPDHSEQEDREILLGHSAQGQLLMVVYTLKTDAIRIISARRVTRKEAEKYARGI